MNSFKQFTLKKQISFVKSKILSLMTNKINESIQIEENIWSNKELNNWLRLHGIEITEKPSFKKGGSGIAYFLPNNKVLKFTEDAVEANIAKMIINTKIGKNIIDVKKIGNKYAILQSKLDTENAPEDIKLAADLVTVMIDEYDLTEFPEDKNILVDMSNNILEKFNMPKKLLKNMLIIIKLIEDLYKKTGFFHNDAGPSNIGVKGNKTYIFDLGPNKTKNYSTEKEIEKIKQKREKLGLNAHEFY